MSVDHLWIGNLPYGTSEEDVYRLAASIGALESVEVHKDQKTGRSMGWAFCRYQNQETTILAKELLDGIEFGGRRISVEWAASRMSVPPTNQTVNNNNNPHIDRTTDRLQLQREIANMTLSQLTELVTNLEAALRTYTDTLSDAVTDNPEAWNSFLKTRQLLITGVVTKNTPE